MKLCGKFVREWLMQNNGNCYIDIILLLLSRKHYLPFGRDHDMPSTAFSDKKYLGIFFTLQVCPQLPAGRPIPIPYYQTRVDTEQTKAGKVVNKLTANVADTIPATSMWRQSLINSSITSLRNRSFLENISETDFDRWARDESAHGGRPSGTFNLRIL